MRGGIGKTFSTTLRLDRIAQATGVPLIETAIGFKYLVPHLVAGRLMVAGEESGGIAFGDFLPDRDGTLSALVLLELLATKRRSLPDLLADLDREFGELAYGRRDIYVPIERGRAFLAAILEAPPREVAGVPVTAVRDLDGVKLVFGDARAPDGWLLHRISGTEPMVRLYCEHPDPGKVDEILSAAATRLTAF